MTMKTTMPLASRRTLVELGGGHLAAAQSASARGATPPESPAVPALGGALAETRHRTVDVGGLQIFYREAGPAAAPVLLLLHGFPTSSRMFRSPMSMLADKYRVIAPDYPAFGHSAVPSRSDFDYTHAHLSEVVEALIEQLGVIRFAIYVMDFGGPIGYRLMLKYPDRVRALSCRTHRRSESRPMARSGRPSWRIWKDGPDD
jgi:pimeloyl-ACP methyl ester carboxylesterase